MKTKMMRTKMIIRTKMRKRIRTIRIVMNNENGENINIL